MYKKIVLAIDQSYTKSGIAIVADGRIMKITSLPFRGCKNKSEKRKVLAGIVHQVIISNAQNTSELVVFCERIRTFSHNAGPKGAGQFISTDYIKSTGALIATIVDAAYDHGIDVYSVDTRSWKAQVLGKASSAKGTNKKLATIKHITSLGYDVSSVNKKGIVVYDDDAADAGCIGLYGFLKEVQQKLKLEH